MPPHYDFQCGTCLKTFPAGWKARDNHCRMTGHFIPNFECETCPRWFRSQGACDQHMNDLNHWPFECSICDETWPTEEECTDHEIEIHLYCADCQRTFQNLNNIRMHRNSSVHKGRQIQCPFCQANYTTATGVTHHVESGGCPAASNLNRDQIYRFIRSKDPNGVISKKLLEWHGSYECEVNEQAWNGYAYQCYLCDREFERLSSLNQHVNSPTHQQAIYHCPNRACRKDFKSLAGFVNHLQSESCGLLRFDQVQDSFGELIRGNRLISF